MCHIRKHLHKICRCQTDYIYLCSTFQVPPCPSYPAADSRFVQVRNSIFVVDILSRCPNLDMYPDIVDPYPCSKHQHLLEEYPALVLGPPPTDGRHGFANESSGESAERCKPKENDNPSIDSKHTSETSGKWQRSGLRKSGRRQDNESLPDDRASEKRKCSGVRNLWGLLDP
ncbi:hypothetical protein CIHG_03198 [Coccidioides immitis H538.4]|uniref:Uncharacterized protein n=2 Tax=Coccidioides immitis TaxID=5501 RepID=A0A0J8TPF4_COCIT|nr:hypothetical protein CISG_04990 [Coccidioides immitis RMSCC 3703]KMU85416.1 hypothetical protein CIHG_03198 [Coccidioides immitis H538.4]